MLILAKVWTFIKHYWYIPIGLIVAIIVMIAMRDKKSLNDWGKTLADASKAHKDEIKVIEDAHAKQKVADRRALERSYEIQRQLHEEYERNEREFDSATKKKIASITKKLKDDPHAMAEAIENETGFRVIILE